MADDRNDKSNDQSHKDHNPKAMGDQGAEGSFGGESAGGSKNFGKEADPNPGGGMSGQPIGGNDSNTGSGTALTSGYTPPSSGHGGTGGSGGGNKAGTDDRGGGIGTGGSAGGSTGERFMLDQGSGSDDIKQREKLGRSSDPTPEGREVGNEQAEDSETTPGGEETEGREGSY